MSAIPLGALLVARPDDGAMGVAPAMFERGPFTTLLIPGCFLLAFGVVHAGALVAVVRARPDARARTSSFLQPAFVATRLAAIALAPRERAQSRS